MVGKGHPSEVGSGRTASWMRLGLVGETAVASTNNGAVVADCPGVVEANCGHIPKLYIGARFSLSPEGTAVGGGHDCSASADRQTAKGVDEGHLVEGLGGGGLDFPCGDGSGGNLRRYNLSGNYSKYQDDNG